MPNTMVPGILFAEWYSNSGLNTNPLTKWWFEYQTTMILGIWITIQQGNNLPRSEYQTSLLFRFPLYIETKLTHPWPNILTNFITNQAWANIPFYFSVEHTDTYNYKRSIFVSLRNALFFQILNLLWLTTQSGSCR